ncbi:MAG: nuclear transport factor 2 family protein [Burkholderiaceae bacterium]
MGVAQRFYEAFTVRDWYTISLLYAEHATFSDPVFPLLNAKGTRLMWQMLLSRAEDLDVDVDVLEDTAQRTRVNWVARYTFSGTGRPVTNRVQTEMQLVAGKIVRQQDTFSLWQWSAQALGAKGALLGWTPIVRNKIRSQASASLRDFARKVAPDGR